MSRPTCTSQLRHGQPGERQDNGPIIRSGVQGIIGGMPSAPTTGGTLREVARGGAALGVCAVVLAVLGLTPALGWIPEVPLLIVAVLLPTFILAMSGSRAGRRTGRLADGALVGGLVGGVGGLVGGLMYVVYGKPAINVLGLAVMGALGGALVGTVAAAWGRRLPKAYPTDQLP